MDDRLLAFVGVSLAVVVIPGPDMALVARNLLRYWVRREGRWQMRFHQGTLRGPDEVATA